ncbi:MAG: flagellar biosynthetic protein FliO [Paucimonas sp.]|uniref:flagellar biosynthetic protein FliO n=1 Tax=Pantoea sp. Cy-639 TaxID=2608360 RepID=UPI00141D9AE0|nr:flagellar biosynthetic protein FliO [Paucimonas sp.]NIF15854.1 flagellar biosynthetic protein FliO [Pantoea sp. Cy-639]
MKGVLRAATALIALLASPLLLAAAEPAAAPAVAPMPASLGGQLAQMVFGLLLVVGLIFFLAWLLRRMQSTAQRGVQAIEIVGSRAIGPRDRLLLVQVGKEQILIGHTPGSIEALHVLAEPVEVPAAARPATPEFAQRLLELMGKDQKDRK